MLLQAAEYRDIGVHRVEGWIETAAKASSPTPVGAENPVTSCDLHVLVDEAAKTCPHVNACLTCPMFVTTAEFLPQHRVHRGQVIELITAAQARGQTRLAEMNQQVLGNLDRIIDTLDHDADHDASVSIEDSDAS